MPSNRMSPNQREALSAISTITQKQEYLTSTSGALNVNATVSISGVATSANQTNGTQKTQIVDGSGNVVGSTTNALDVNIKSGGGGAVTQGTSPWIVAGGGTAGSAASGVLTVQGVTSMTKLLVTPDSVALPANQSVNEAQINGVTPLMGNGVTGTGSQRVTIASDNTSFSVKAIGTTASGSSISVAPVTIGGQAKTANPTAVTDGQVVNATFDKLGKQVVVGSIRDLKLNQITTITASTAETTVLTSVASTFLDVYGVICINSSATATNVSFKDATAGTTRFNIYVPAGDTRGFMLPESGAVTQAAVANNWTATSSASITSLIITMLAVKNL